MVTREEMFNILRKEGARKEEETQNILQHKKIVIQRRQDNTNYPAIAKLIIEFPTSELTVDVKKVFYEYEAEHHLETDTHKITRQDTQTFIIEVRSDWRMYSWLEEYIKKLLEECKLKKVGLLTKGTWEKYDVEQIDYSP